jgi:hypothetical protein
MYAGKDFTAGDPGESEVFSFDFSCDLQEGETIAGATWTCDVVRGTDANAPTRLLGAPVNAAPLTSHRVGGLLAGVRYRLQAVITTSLSNTLSQWSHISCRAPV